MSNGPSPSTSLGLSRKQGIAIIFAFAVFVALILHLSSGGGFDPVLGLPSLAGLATALFLISGLIPCLVWAMLKFRARSLQSVMMAWTILLLIITGFVYLGQHTTLPQ